MQSFSEDWETIHSTQEWGKYPCEHVIRFIARNYYKTDRKKVKILDFGCGGGAHTWYLAREGFDVYAFDGSKSAVEKTQKILHKDNFHDVHLSVQDGADIKYDNDFFDCVIDNVCIYANKMDSIQTMYQNIYRILKQGGSIFSSCFGTKTDGYGEGICLEEGTFKDITKGVLAERGTAHFYYQEEFRNVLESAGFHDVKTDYMFYTDNGQNVEMFFASAKK